MIIRFPPPYHLGSGEPDLLGREEESSPLCLENLESRDGFFDVSCEKQKGPGISS
jgi:hypothetical protein